MLAQHLQAYPSDDYLFTSLEGHRVDHMNFAPRHFVPAVKRLGDGLPPKFRCHDLRHSHASILVAQGRSQEQIRDRLGHGSIRTTSDWYSHLFDGHDDDLLDGLDATIRAALS